MKCNSAKLRANSDNSFMVLNFLETEVCVRRKSEEEVRRERKVRGMLLQPASSQPGLLRRTVILLENSITVRITEQNKRMEVITQTLSVPNCMEIGTSTEDHKQCHEKHPRPCLSHQALVYFQPGMQDP
ncbi:hypothetical protein TNCV_3478401 [Trichonephila clavipes]|nr:hypothetical protein TNCV_3478401 [Trichonephila clavipes]